VDSVVAESWAAVEMVAAGRAEEDLAAVVWAVVATASA